MTNFDILYVALNLSLNKNELERFIIRPKLVSMKLKAQFLLTTAHSQI